MVNNPRTPIISGTVVGFIIGAYLGSLIDHQMFTGIVSVMSAALCAGLGMFIGYKISQGVQ
jgi:uncharacterized protein YcfJ